jgi:hypothetical protein
MHNITILTRRLNKNNVESTRDFITKSSSLQSEAIAFHPSQLTMTNPLQDPVVDDNTASGINALKARRPLQIRQQNVIVGGKLVRDSTNLNRSLVFF